MENNQSRREFLGKALAAVAIAALNPVSIFLTPKDLLASGGDQKLGLFSVDLTLTKYAALKNVGGSVAITIAGPNIRIILTRFDATTFYAVNRTCPHAGNLVNTYSKTLQRIVCPAHGSEFLADGTLEVGPANRSLTKYTTTFVESNNTVLVDIPGLAVKDENSFIIVPDLHQNYPNPVITKTTIGFKTAVYSHVTLTVTDIMGHIIAVLHDGALSAGEYSFDFDASIFPAGTYFYHLNADGEVQTKQMVVMK
ncbi:MAG: Rieske 2Fe-2S domain-containing protein [Bacteroidota bacterium]|nr:Rieske 2Fe-2S domain-containing protein [Bacteroidota bacterium]MDP4229704.1 Rieske 2Fe-2S domain-containing protein [Bacteroidota bacterium]MDP4237313.1 Rieske 2Fe-2S domain-containing protein [Bacteroidota bacterium]